MIRSNGPGLAMSVVLMFAGPAAIGAALGLFDGPSALITRAVVFPTIIIGVAALMLPALYIGAAFLGVAPKAQAVARSARAALGDMGVVFLGLAAPLFFLVAASTELGTVRVLGHLIVGVGVALGLRALFIRLFDRRSPRAIGLFAGWSLVSVGIGAQLFARTIPL